MFNITELTCRICLQEQDVLINIYDELEELHTNLSNLLETCADLQITEYDIFPKYLCEDCTRELLITSKFREKCDKSKEILYKIVENSKVLENEESLIANDIIEYCTEDDIEDLIIHEPAVESEIEADKLIEEVEPEKLDVSVSLLRKNSIKQINATQLSSQLENKSVSEEPLLPEDSSNRLELFTVKFLEEEVQPIIVSRDNATLLGQKEVNQNLNMPFTEISKRYRIFKCDVCGALFKQAINLQKHFQKSHEAVHCFNCFKCDHWFSIEKELCKHVENCNYEEVTSEFNADNKKILTEKIFATSIEQEHSRQCVYCKREFPTPFALRMHIRTHTGERPFECKYCTKSFKTQSQLNVHHKRHTGQADFICTICNKSFYEQSNLTVHMRSHTGERPHVCTICNKTFTRVFLLQFHMRTHTGEKPYKCNFCDKCFRQQTDLRSHLSIHTGQKKHSCIICGKSYAKRSHLSQHMRKHLLHNNSSEKGNGIEFKNDHITEELSNGYDNQNYSFEELTTATDTIQNYVQNTKIVYSYDEIIQCEDVVTK